MSGDITALLGPGTRFEGKLHFDGCVRIDGVFRGEIRSDDTLIVGEGAEIDGTITVATVIVRGKIQGDIFAKTSIELFAPGVVIGDVTTPEFAVERGARFDGRCMMHAPASTADDLAHGATEAPRPPRERPPPPAPVGPPRRASV
jgi:cytoskeletal protein CcmA (bactofilin family)